MFVKPIRIRARPSELGGIEEIFTGISNFVQTSLPLYTQYEELKLRQKMAEASKAALTSFVPPPPITPLVTQAPTAGIPWNTVMLGGGLLVGGFLLVSVMKSRKRKG